MEPQPPGVRRPIDIATRETSAFIEAWLGTAPRRVLEVGAGEGHVAEALGRLGHEVVAIDADAPSVEKARERGVDARHVQWPDFSDAPFDAVVFTRSLHHIGDLDAAVARTVELLVPRGLVLVEDFAFETLDNDTVGWFRDHLRVIDAAVGIDARDDAFVSRVLSGDTGEAIVATDAHHDLHSWSRLQECLTGAFNALDTCSTPYLYRYLIRVAPERAGLTDVVAALLDAELAAADRRWIRRIGRRFVGRRPIR